MVPLEEDDASCAVPAGQKVATLVKFDRRYDVRYS